MRQRTYVPSLAWLAVAVAIALASIAGSIAVHRAVVDNNEEQFAVGVEAAESELRDRIRSFSLITLLIPAVMSGEFSDISIDFIEEFMAGTGLFSGNAAPMLAASPLDGLDGVGFIGVEPDGSVDLAMVLDRAGLTAVPEPVPAVDRVIAQAVSDQRSAVSDPFQLDADGPHLLAHITPISDRLLNVAIVNLERVVAGSVTGTGSQLVHLAVVDAVTGVEVADTGSESGSPFESVLSLGAFGRRWEITATQGPGFSPQDPAIPALATLGLGLLVALLTYVVGVQTRRRWLTQVDQLKSANEANEDKDRFIAAVSHELRTPLTSIVGLAAEIADAPDRFALEEIGELTGIMARQSNEMAMLVEDLLVAARTQAGTVTVQPRPIDLSDQVTMIIEDLGVLSESVSVSGSGTAWADPLRVRQIVRNLITNAMRHGGPKIWVTLSETSDDAVVEVSDDGPPIPDDAQARMFEPYYRSADTQGQAPSVGLGLSVSRELAVLMDGRLDYTYAAGRSTFQLRLPLVLIDHGAGASGILEA